MTDATSLLSQDPGSLWFAFGLTMLAGLATGIGSLLAFFTDQTNRKFLAVAGLLRGRHDLRLNGGNLLQGT